jgi:hypothetical protein
MADEWVTEDDEAMVTEADEPLLVERRLITDTTRLLI